MRRAGRSSPTAVTAASILPVCGGFRWGQLRLSDRQPQRVVSPTAVPTVAGWLGAVPGLCTNCGTSRTGARRRLQSVWHRSIYGH